MQSFVIAIRSYRVPLTIGLVAWVALAAAGAIHGRIAGLPALHAITAWSEWCTAILLLPGLVTMGTVPRRDRAGRPTFIAYSYAIALVVFGLDLLLRAVLGLGWDPFLVG